ncbi:MAG: outer membrane protein assembly factor BamE [Aquabacterium sp.]
MTERRQRQWERLLAVVLAAVLLMALAGVLAGCDQLGSQKLVEDVSTEADVRRYFGEPKTVTVQPDGSRTLEYPRQPEGSANYRIVIGANGRMTSLRQLLNPDNLARVKPGMDGEQVRDIAGPPARQLHFALKNEMVWEWRYREGQQPRLFSATFNPQGQVLGTAMVDDPAAAQVGGK